MAKKENEAMYSYERINRRWGQYELLIDREVWNLKKTERVKILEHSKSGNVYGFNEKYNLLIAADARVQVQRVATGKTRILKPSFNIKYNGKTK